MADMSPDEAAQYAQGEQAAAEGGLGGDGLQGGASGGTSPMASMGGPVERLFDGDQPGPSVSELRHDYEMPKDMAIASRGVLRAATGSGVPPIFEIMFGGFMAYMKRSGGGGVESEPGHGDLPTAGEGP